MTGFKFHHQLDIGASFAKLLGERLEKIPVPDCIIPVPLHPKRLKERGFNQALELIKPFARRRQIPIHQNACARQRYTPDQVGLSALQRRRNLRDAFVVQERLPKHVAIIDDVITTGATALNVARVLRRAGAETIQLWAVARTV